MQARLQKVAEDGPYARQAYEFVMQALDYSMRRLTVPRHLSGHELLDGIQSFALSEFGPMARHVLNHWGVHDTKDVGQIVFALVSHGILAKTDEDELADFEGGFDFEEAFEKNYYAGREDPGEGTGAGGASPFS